MKLDLENDCASIFGRQVDFQCTSSGHYCVPLQQSDVVIDEIFSVLLCNDSDDSTFKQKQVETLHKQFAHPTSDRLKALMKDAGIKESKCLELVDLVPENCQVCKRFERTPARPMGSLPIATEFNEVVAMDLKVWKPGIYFLHLIDMATRFSLASVIRNKNPETIIQQVMIMWIGSGLGAPKKFLADNGGECKYKDMCSNLNIEPINTAAYSPWQNGICE